MPDSITCPICQRTSHNPNDIEHGYCGHCHEFHEKPQPAGILCTGSSSTETELIRRFPSIPWGEPLPVTVTDGVTGLACRLCVAARGLKGAEVGNLPQTREEFEKHMKEAHGDKKI